ncbi:mannose-1-phosphate guanylyltransferase [Candidatus Dependentiae bacterium]
MKKKIFFSLCFFLCILKSNNSKARFCEAPMKYKNVKYKNAYFIILAGGSGTRLWPLSRQEKPKQFLEVGEEKTLIDQAIERVSAIAPKENIWISTTKNHEENIKRYVGDKIGHIVVEPGLRNTAPAILLACLELHKKDPDAVVMFLPSDPFIEDKDKFVAYVKSAIEFSMENNHITLFGITPTYPATGYGYIEFDNVNKKDAPYQVLKFHEKPKLEVAKAYVAQDNMVWNICMFCGKVKVFLEEFAKEAPEIFDGVTKYVNGHGDYNDVKSDSIDYAVMEKSKNIFVIPADFPWCDVGNIEVFLTIQKQNMQLDENVVSVDSKNNMVSVKDKLVALVGVDNLCIVETNDTLLITKRNQAEKVRQIVQQLKKSKNQTYL